MWLDYYSIYTQKLVNFMKVWDVSIEDRREPIHGGLTAAVPAADILASHTPYLLFLDSFLIKKE